MYLAYLLTTLLAESGTLMSFTDLTCRLILSHHFLYIKDISEASFLGGHYKTLYSPRANLTQAGGSSDSTTQDLLISIHRLYSSRYAEWKTPTAYHSQTRRYYSNKGSNSG
ncbi:hypothetical protein J6590_061002 [Homalodisca vitripennis]|nr:hypothetical protein J6590_061002 [Homalodisca vitripennis]